MSHTREFIRKRTEEVLGGTAASQDDAVRMLYISRQPDVFYLLSHANIIRDYFRGDRIGTCAIVNARSGRCSEDCVFCAQSKQHAADIATYGLMADAKLIEAAQEAARHGVQRFSIVTSGKGCSSEAELEVICSVVRRIADSGSVLPCVSLGILSSEQFAKLRSSGLRRYHHNLESAPSFFPQVCSTHAFDDRVHTIRRAASAGLEICAGGLFGMGETPEQRIELAAVLRDLDVDSVPLNFLHPIRGTPLENAAALHPLEILATIAAFRFMLPAKEIRVCGGRGYGLKTLQPLIYAAGADGVMVGNYLTTKGSSIATDVEEVHGMGLKQ